MSTCIGCSAEIELAASFCPKCGTPNPESPTITPAEHAAETEQIPPDELKRRLQAALGKDFVLGQMLGEGGFAVVFAAQDRKLSRRIAVKVLRPELGASKSTVQRFVREAESAANLSHPHILPIFFVGEGEGLVYFGMPLVDGETLEQRLTREKQLAEPEVARIGAEIAEALAEAHAAGLVHRDVKPANVLLQGPKKRVMVADFGIAKASGASGGKLTGTGSIIGSPHYMSPEQAAGSQDVDHRSDIYSLGVVLWQMLAGELPFDGPDTQSILVQHLTQPLPPLAKKRPGVSTALLRIVECCCEKKPQHRYQNVADVAAALRSGQAPERARPKRARALALASVGAVLVAAAAVLTLGGQDEDVPAATATAPAAPVRSAAPMLAVLPFEMPEGGDTARGRQSARNLANTIAARFGVPTIDVNRMLGQWASERRSLAAPLDSNAAFAYRMNANQLVLGTIFESGRMRRVSADVYDTRTLEMIGHSEVDGDQDSLLRVLDQLAGLVAQSLCRQPEYNPRNLCYDSPAQPQSDVGLSGSYQGEGVPHDLAFNVHVSADGRFVAARPRQEARADVLSDALGALQRVAYTPARKGTQQVQSWAIVPIVMRQSVSAATAGQDAACLTNPTFGLANRNRVCFEVRPNPRVATVISAPPSCGPETRPAMLVARISPRGEVVDRPSVSRGSGCEAFDNAALAFVLDMTFAPAQKAGVLVEAWTVIAVQRARP